MLTRARELDSADEYVPGDIERLPFADNSIDICFSNLAVQWCNALPRALEEMHRVTRNGGLVIFSTLAEGSLNELAAAWMKVDGRRHVNKFLTPDKIAEACAPSPLVTLGIHRRIPSDVVIRPSKASVQRT